MIPIPERLLQLQQQVFVVGAIVAPVLKRAVEALVQRTRSTAERPDARQWLFARGGRQPRLLGVLGTPDEDHRIG